MSNNLHLNNLLVSQKMQQIKSYLCFSVIEKYYPHATCTRQRLDIKLFNLEHIADNIHVGAFHVENSCVSATRIRDKDPLRLVASTYRGYPLIYTKHDVPISSDRATRLVT